MSQIKEKQVKVKVNENGEEKTINIIVRKPTNAMLSKAQMVSARVWTECARDNIMTKKELEKFMKEHDIWNEDKDQEQKKITEAINSLERKLYLGDKRKRISKSEGKRIAIEMRKKRIELRDLISERMAFEQNTAEAIADNARFDFLVSCSTYKENGERVYKDLDDYTTNSDNEIAFAAATALAQMMYSVDKDFEAKLPENKFLKTFNFVNEELSLVNESGQTVDAEGKPIDSSGYYLNDEGKRVDKDGNLLDEDGRYVLSVEYTDEETEEVEVTSAPTTSPKKSNRKKATDS